MPAAGEVYRLDIQDTCSELPADRCRFGQTEAADPVPAARTMSEWGVLPGSPDVIVEDASHSFRDPIATDHLLWDFVGPGGWYVIEDVEPWTPLAPFVRLGVVVYDLRGVKGRHDDVLILFQK